MLPRHLVQGYQMFKATRFQEQRDRYQVLASAGQRPQTMVIGCADSRAAPETVFSASPGELFVVRNVANLVPPYVPDGNYHGTSAAVEYAVNILRVRTVLVMGHGGCGGIAGHLKGASRGSDFLGKWLTLVDSAAAELQHNRCIDDKTDMGRLLEMNTATVELRVAFADDTPGLLAGITAAITASNCDIGLATITPKGNTFMINISDGWSQLQTLKRALSTVHGVASVSFFIPEISEDLQRALELMSIKNSIRNLRSFPFIKALEDIKEITLIGCWFDISSGSLLALDEESGKWSEAI